MGYLAKNWASFFKLGVSPLYIEFLLVVVTEFLGKVGYKMLNRSSAEIEYKAMAPVACALIWLIQLTLIFDN